MNRTPLGYGFMCCVMLCFILSKTFLHFCVFLFGSVYIIVYICIIQKTENEMTNLITKLSQELQNELADFKVSVIFIEYSELNVRSEYDMDYTYYEAIEQELKSLGYDIED